VVDERCISGAKWAGILFVQVCSLIVVEVAGCLSSDFATRWGLKCAWHVRIPDQRFCCLESGVLGPPYRLGNLTKCFMVREVWSELGGTSGTRSEGNIRLDLQFMVCL